MERQQEMCWYRERQPANCVWWSTVLCPERSCTSCIPLSLFPFVLLFSRLYESSRLPAALASSSSSSIFHPPSTYSYPWNPPYAYVSVAVFARHSKSPAAHVPWPVDIRQQPPSSHFFGSGRIPRVPVLHARHRHIYPHTHRRRGGFERLTLEKSLAELQGHQWGRTRDAKERGREYTSVHTRGLWQIDTANDVKQKKKVNNWIKDLYHTRSIQIIIIIMALWSVVDSHGWQNSIRCCRKDDGFFFLSSFLLLINKIERNSIKTFRNIMRRQRLSSNYFVNLLSSSCHRFLFISKKERWHEMNLMDNILWPDGRVPYDAKRSSVRYGAVQYCLA